MPRPRTSHTPNRICGTARDCISDNGYKVFAPEGQITFQNCCVRLKLCYLGDCLKLSIPCQSKLLWEERDCICVIVGSVFVRLHLRYLYEWGGVFGVFVVMIALRRRRKSI